MAGILCGNAGHCKSVKYLLTFSLLCLYAGSRFNNKNYENYPLPVTRLALSTLFLLFLGVGASSAAVLASYIDGSTGLNKSVISGDLEIASLVDPDDTGVDASTLFGHSTMAGRLGGASGPVRKDLGGSGNSGIFGSYWLTFNGSNTSSSFDNNPGYFQFSVAAVAAGSTIQLDELTFDWAWGTNSGADDRVLSRYQISWSINGGIDWNEAYSVPGDSAAVNMPASGFGYHDEGMERSHDLSGIDAAEEFLIRVSVIDNTDLTGVAPHLFQNIQLHGTVIPEPTISLLGLLGVLALLGRRRP